MGKVWVGKTNLRCGVEWCPKGVEGIVMRNQVWVELNGVGRRRELNRPMSLEGPLEVHSVGFICASALRVGELLRHCRAGNMAMRRRSDEV
jgi:hypothetical protein